eukprot:4293717-Amphidinium_carterae.1
MLCHAPTALHAIDPAGSCDADGSDDGIEGVLSDSSTDIDAAEPSVEAATELIRHKLMALCTICKIETCCHLHALVNWTHGPIATHRIGANA